MRMEGWGKRTEEEGEGWGNGTEGWEGEGRHGERGMGIPVSEVVSVPYTNSVCWSGAELK